MNERLTRFGNKTIELLDSIKDDVGILVNEYEKMLDKLVVEHDVEVSLLKKNLLRANLQINDLQNELMRLKASVEHSP